MKTLITTLAATAALATPVFAESAAERAAALFAMSNNSAAEIMLSDTSIGDVSVAQMRFALGNMSAAERKTFFEADTSTQKKILDAQIILMNGDSAAEATN
ncbi:MAG: hypothetical protein AAF340_13705 [Pseudomonadota bacterium]